LQSRYKNGICGYSASAFGNLVSMLIVILVTIGPSVKTATEVEVRAIQDHKVIEWNTCWKCRLSEGTDDI
jgi:hypothetical protein